MAKIKVCVTIREDFVKWVKQQVKTLRFASRSHAIEYALAKLIESERKE